MAKFRTYIESELGMFQSFFYWNCLGGQRRKFGQAKEQQFQSFFYWNCLGGGKFSLMHGTHFSVSILLLLELPWWHARPSFIGVDFDCFNPSFTGIALVAGRP